MQSVYIIDRESHLRAASVCLYTCTNVPCIHKFVRAHESYTQAQTDTHAPLHRYRDDMCSYMCVYVCDSDYTAGWRVCGRET